MRFVYKKANTYWWCSTRMFMIMCVSIISFNKKISNKNNITADREKEREWSILPEELV